MEAKTMSASTDIGTRIAKDCLWETNNRATGIVRGFLIDSLRIDMVERFFVGVIGSDSNCRVQNHIGYVGQSVYGYGDGYYGYQTSLNQGYVAGGYCIEQNSAQSGD